MNSRETSGQTNSALHSRRDFLVASGGVLAAASLTSVGARPALAQAQPRQMGFAFVGIGGFMMGQLLPGIARSKYSKCVAVVTGHPEKVDEGIQGLGGRSIRQQFGLKDSDVYSYENFEKIKDNPNIDVVYIVLPNGMHAEYTVRAFAAGKHVLCEKPMANTAKEAQTMIDAAKKAGKRLQIGYRMHWDTPTLACIDSLRKGSIGQMQIIEAEQGFTIGGPQWRLDKKLAGGGCLMDIGIYALSAARYLSGEEPTEVVAYTYADPNNPKFAEVEQTCNFMLKFPSGIVANCASSYNTNLGRFVIHGTRGQAAMDPASSYTGCKFWLGNTAQNVPEGDQFAEMDGFSLALQGAGDFKATGEEGLQDMKIIDAIYESAASGKAVKL